MSTSPDRKAEKKMNGARVEEERLTLIKEALRRKRSAILEQQTTQLSALHSPDKHHLADLEEMGSDASDTDSLCAIFDLGSSTMEQIDAALEKLEAGNYGTCELCEEPIHPDRLDALPFAALCVKCQRKKELTPSESEED